MKDKISAKEAEQYIRNIFNEFKNEGMDVTVKFSNTPEFFSGTGMREAHDIKNPTIMIGCPADCKLMTEGKGRFHETISMKDFVFMVIAANHEAQHIRQDLSFYKPENKDNEKIRKMAIQSAAVVGNECFYHNDYGNNICEMDAESEGLKRSLAGLNELIGKEQTERYIREYMHECIESKGLSQRRYFGIEKNDDIQTMLKALDKRIEEEVKHKTPFGYDFANEIKGQGPGRDVVKEDDVFFRHLIDDPEKQKMFHFSEFVDNWKIMELMVVINERYNGNASPIENGHILKDDPMFLYCEACYNLMNGTGNQQRAEEIRKAFMGPQKAPTIHEELQDKRYLDARRPKEPQKETEKEKEKEETTKDGNGGR